MAGIKLTKNELKKQKDSLKRYKRYLPTLMLKKQQLQMVIRQVEAKERSVSMEKENLQARIESWIALFGEPWKWQEYLFIERIVTTQGNIAGVDIPVFSDVIFGYKEYDLFQAPLWIDKALEVIKVMLKLDAEISVLKEQIQLLDTELRITTQRVNLFEKVKIPEAKNAIRKIQIYLGDQQTAAVVRGKIAKSNMVKVEQQ